jgi:hypothetical protein
MKSVAIIGAGRVIRRDLEGNVSSTPGYNEKRDVPWDDPEWEKWSCNALYEVYPTEGDRRYMTDEEIDDDALLESWIEGGVEEAGAQTLVDASKAFRATVRSVIPDYYDAMEPPPAYHFDRWFQLHTPAYMRRHWNKPDEWPQHEEWLRREHPFPIYMQRRYKKYPSSVEFPREQVEELGPLGHYQLFTFSWLLAYAISEGFERIGLFGVDGGPGEPLGSRACLEYWIGFAHGRGIEVEVVGANLRAFKSHHRADLYSDLVYGYDHEPALDLGNGWRDVRVR